MYHRRAFPKELVLEMIKFAWFNASAAFRMLVALSVLTTTSCVSIRHQSGTASAKPRREEPAKPAARPAPKPAAKPAPKPAAKPAPKPAAKPAPKPAAVTPAPSATPAAKPAAPTAPAALPPPAAAAVAAKRPVSEDSVFVLPLRVDFDAAIAKIDGLLEKKASATWKTVSKPGDSPKVDVRYELWRDRPIAAAWKDGTLTLSVPVRYAANVRAQVKNPLGGWVWVTKDESWGTKSEPQEITATFEAKISLGDDLRVHATTRLAPLAHGKAPSGDVCIKALAKLCVSKETLTPMVRRHIDGYLTPKIARALEQSGAQLDAALNLGTRMRTLWSALQKPQSLQSVGQTNCPLELGVACKQPAWLVMQPKTLHVSELRMEGRDLRVDVGITGRLAAQLGAAPKVSAVALPKLSPSMPGQGFTVHVGLQIAAPEVAGLLGKALASQRFESKDKTQALTVKSLKLSSTVDAKHPERLSIVVAVSGALEAQLTLVGDLKYDATQRELAIASFDYDLATQELAAKQLAAIPHEALRSKIAQAARWSLGAHNDALQKALLTAFNGTLRDQLIVSGTLKNLALESVEVAPTAIAASVLLSGDLELRYAPK
jgi:Domain of unknown function (DUF4403)